MKKTIISGFMLVSLVWLVQNINGQPIENRLEKLHSQKIAFFTDKLQLTPAEAEKFWPVYNDYTNRKNKLDEESKTLMKYITRNSDNLSDKEINESMEKFLQLQEQIHKLFLDYHQQYLQILPPKKVMKIYITENQFKAVLLNQIRESRQPVRAPVR